MVQLGRPHSLGTDRSEDVGTSVSIDMIHCLIASWLCRSVK
jgi:hypothetical protein